MANSFTGIATLQPEEFEIILPLLLKFHEESGLKMENPTLDVIAHFVSIGMGVVFVYVKDEKIIGTLGAMVAPNLFSPSEQHAQELFWYVDKKSRGRAGLALLDAFEKWAKERGAKRVFMASLRKFESLQKLFTRRGYTEMETQFIKEI